MKMPSGRRLPPIKLRPDISSSRRASVLHAARERDAETERRDRETTRLPSPVPGSRRAELMDAHDKQSHAGHHAGIAHCS
jgi:hypothetical protein